ncbi:MAG: high-potential iron-sulfur protein [Saprospiraceae bacterium]|nr:high-potential iron-sulfur protein [Saprospiraceae bacterium]
MKIVSISLLITLSCKKTEKNEKSESFTLRDCEDLSQVSPEEIKKRESLGYTKESPMPDKNCTNCNLYSPPSGAKICGGCMLFKGPVLAEAYCTYWAPQI